MKRLPLATSSALALWTCIVLLAYLSYRYPLQINFSGTSQVYSDTPTWLQVPKFLLGGAACVALLWLGRALPLGRAALAYVLAFVALQGWGLAKAAATGEGGFADAATWALVSLFLGLYAARTDARVIERFLGLLLYVAFAIDAVQVALFFTIGRLPALAWEGTLSVRFGSFLDDPNGFSALCFLLLGWALRTPRAWLRWSQVGMVVAMLLAAQSLTALGLLAVFFAGRFALQVVRMEGARPLLVLVACVAVAGAAAWAMSDTLAALYDLKQGSIAQHGAFDLQALLDRSLPELLFGGVRFRFFESWWLQAYVDFGMPYLLAQAGLAAWTLAIAWKRAQDPARPDAARVYAGFALLQLFVPLAAGNLPLYAVFPVNLVYHMTCFLTVFDRVRDDRRTPDGRDL